MTEEKIYYESDDAKITSSYISIDKYVSRLNISKIKSSTYEYNGDYVELLYQKLALPFIITVIIAFLIPIKIYSLEIKAAKEIILPAIVAAGFAGTLILFRITILMRVLIIGFKTFKFITKKPKYKVTIIYSNYLGVDLTALLYKEEKEAKNIIEAIKKAQSQHAQKST